MSMHFNDHHNRIRRAQRFVWAGAIGIFVLWFLIAVGLVVGALYLLTSMDWAELARGAGGMVREFNKGMEGQ
jgi:hypothetical protein